MALQGQILCPRELCRRAGGHPNLGTPELGSSIPRYHRGVGQKSIKSSSVLSLSELPVSSLAFLNCAGISGSHEGNPVLLCNIGDQTEVLAGRVDLSPQPRSRCLGELGAGT